MFLLVAEFSSLFEWLIEGTEALGWFASFANFMFHHVPWEGLHFWDLIQPFFVFIVGVSIPLSYANRVKKGDTVSAINRHAFQRAFYLLLPRQEGALCLLLTWVYSIHNNFFKRVF